MEPCCRSRPILVVLRRCWEFSDVGGSSPDWFSAVSVLIRHWGSVSAIHASERSRAGRPRTVSPPVTHTLSESSKPGFRPRPKCHRGAIAGPSPGQAQKNTFLTEVGSPTSLQDSDLAQRAITGAYACDMRATCVPYGCHNACLTGGSPKWLINKCKLSWVGFGSCFDVLKAGFQELNVRGVL